MPITRLPTQSDFLEKIFVTNSGCWEWTGFRNKDGYGVTGFRVRGKRKFYLAHRISYSLFKKLVPDNKCVCHRCDNPGCVNPSHLVLKTRLWNNKDRGKKGRTAKGENSGPARLLDKQVLDLRNKWESGTYSQTLLAKIFGICQPQVSKLVNNKQRKN